MINEILEQLSYLKLKSAYTYFKRTTYKRCD